jgi:hypothetical protein
MISDFNHLEELTLCLPHQITHSAKYGVDPAASDQLESLAVRRGAHCAREVIVKLEWQEFATAFGWNYVAGAVTMKPVLAQTALQRRFLLVLTAIAVFLLNVHREIGIPAEGRHVVWQSPSVGILGAQCWMNS